MATSQGGPLHGATPQPPPFLRIPAELRNQIYLNCQSPVICVGIGIHDDTTSLLATCKQVRQEASKLMYASCRRMVLVIKPIHVKNTITWLRHQGPTKLSAVKHLHITLDDSAMLTPQDQSTLHMASLQGHQKPVVKRLKKQYLKMGQDLVKALVQAGMRPADAWLNFRIGRKDGLSTIEQLLTDEVEDAIKFALFLLSRT